MSFSQISGQLMQYFLSHLRNTAVIGVVVEESRTNRDTRAKKYGFKNFDKIPYV